METVTRFLPLPKSQSNLYCVSAALNLQWISLCCQVGPSGSLTCSCSMSDHKWLQDCVITIEYRIAGNFQVRKLV